MMPFVPTAFVHRPSSQQCSCEQVTRWPFRAARGHRSSQHLLQVVGTWTAALTGSSCLESLQLSGLPGPLHRGSFSCACSEPVPSAFSGLRSSCCLYSERLSLLLEGRGRTPHHPLGPSLSLYTPVEPRAPAWTVAHGFALSRLPVNLLRSHLTTASLTRVKQEGDSQV